MTVPRYPIPAETVRIEIRVVNSRFLATIGEARTAEEARAFLTAVRKEFPDATFLYQNTAFLPIDQSIAGSEMQTIGKLLGSVVCGDK